MKALKSSQGFTLIELLVVMVILGILAGLSIPQLAGRTERARFQAAKTDIEGGISLALDLYELDMGKYPESLSELISDSTDSRRWRGPYLKRGMPKDPWGHSYIYRYPGTENRSSYDLLSVGSDGEEGTGDEVANFSNP